MNTDNKIGDEGAAAIAEMLKKNSSITTLFLGGTSFPISIFSLSFPLLFFLSFFLVMILIMMVMNTGNEIGPEGAAAIAEMLKKNTSITTLNLYGTSFPISIFSLSFSFLFFLSFSL